MSKATAAVARTVRLIVPAAKAKPSPAIGQALGQLGVNMMMFCKDFNAKTTHYKDDIPLRVSFTAYPDKTFSFTPLGPFSSWLVKQAAGVGLGAAQTGKERVGTIHVKQLFEIARVKQSVEPGLKAIPLESLCRSLAATCRSMGIAIDARPRDVPAGTKRSPAPAMAVVTKDKKKGGKK